jgi:hypothetical protein
LPKSAAKDQPTMFKTKRSHLSSVRDDRRNDIQLMTAVPRKYITGSPNQGIRRQDRGPADSEDQLALAQETVNRFILPPPPPSNVNFPAQIGETRRPPAGIEGVASGQIPVKNFQEQRPQPASNGNGQQLTSGLKVHTVDTLNDRIV